MGSGLCVARVEGKEGSEDEAGSANGEPKLNLLK